MNCTDPSKQILSSESEKNEEEIFLSSYNVNDYERPSVATDIAVFSIFRQTTESHRKDDEATLHILLIKRAGHPFKNKWALPGGFIRSDETAEECAWRETKEETNVEPVSLLPVGVFSTPDRDPRSRTISLAYASIVNAEKVQVVGGSDASNAKWFNLEFDFDENNTLELRLTCDDEKIITKLRETNTQPFIKSFEAITDTGLAFDHTSIIATALAIIKDKAANNEIIFDFLEDKFTLADLQRIQELLTGSTALTANFRRKISSLVEETDEFTEGAGHRPARLFRKKQI